MVEAIGHHFSGGHQGCVHHHRRLLTTARHVPRFLTNPPNTDRLHARWLLSLIVQASDLFLRSHDRRWRRGLIGQRRQCRNNHVWYYVSEDPYWWSDQSVRRWRRGCRGQHHQLVGHPHVIFTEFPRPGSDERWIEVDTPEALSCLQHRLNLLHAGVRIEVLPDWPWVRHASNSNGLFFIGLSQHHPWDLRNKPPSK